MLKLLIGFVIFAALAIFILTRSGGDVDLGGEKHSVEAPHAPASAPAAVAAPAPSAPAAASAAASAASS
jgi:hypothetical protein